MKPLDLRPTRKHRILIVDDEPDMHTVSRMSLKSMRHGGRRVEFLSASSGAEAVEMMRREQNVAVILLDVVMESDHAGLDACNAIRKELDNRFVRILLRTGQPGAAPERQVIEDFDIDGYLPKAELTSSRLWTSVRTSLKAYYEIVELERHRQSLAAIHDCAVSLHAYQPIDVSLERILDAVVTICPADLAVLQLETFEQNGTQRRYFLHRGGDDAVATEAEATRIQSSISADLFAAGSKEPRVFGEGYLVPLRMQHELGHGWIYLSEPSPDEIVAQALSLMAAQSVTALYGAVAQSMMASREEELFDEMAI